MAIRYLRRPPKPVGGKPKRAPAAPLEITPEERVAMAQSLAFFCVACGREHTSAEVRAGDLCCAEAKIKAAIHRVQP